MVRPRRGEIRQDMAKQIKDTARQQMAELGTAGLSLRGIARQLGVTAPAIYNYFPRLDDLITALLVDGFNDLAETMMAAGEEKPDTTLGGRIRDMMLTFRVWALENPMEFQLIYGSPIPGYSAPEDVTTPLARRPFELLFALFLEAYLKGEVHLPVEPPLPESITHHVTGWTESAGLSIPPELVEALIRAWTQYYGMVALELFHHTGPIIGDTQAFYTHALDSYLANLGLSPPG